MESEKVHGPPLGRSAPAATAPAEPWPESEISATRHFLVYPVKWGRAEDLAATLEPIIQARYGSAARVVPSVETNKLFIYIPSEREASAAAGGGARAPGSSPAPAARRRAGTGRQPTAPR